MNRKLGLLPPFAACPNAAEEGTAPPATPAAINSINLLRSKMLSPVKPVHCLLVPAALRAAGTCSMLKSACSILSRCTRGKDQKLQQMAVRPCFSSLARPPPWVPHVCGLLPRRTAWDWSTFRPTRSGSFPTYSNLDLPPTLSVDNCDVSCPTGVEVILAPLPELRHAWLLELSRRVRGAGLLVIPSFAKNVKDGPPTVVVGRAEEK